MFLTDFWWSTWVYGKVSGVNYRSLETMLNLEFSHWSELLPTAVFLINRSTPLGVEESIEKWDKLREAYFELAYEQKQRYPVFTINNDHDIAETLNDILKAMAQLGNKQIVGHLPSLKKESANFASR